MIHISKVRKELNKHEIVDLKFWKKDGAIVVANNVTCTSTFFQNDSANLKFNVSNEFRKIRVWNIFEFNGEEVCM